MRFVIALFMGLMLNFGVARADVTTVVANAPPWAPSTAYAASMSGALKAVQAAGTSCVDGDIVTASGGTVTTAAQFQVSVVTGSVVGIRIYRAGVYTAVPSNPVSASGGSCSGLTLTVSWTSMPVRITAGPGLVVPSTYTSGSAIYLWQVTVGGTTSGSGNGPQSCPSPGTSTVTDGSVTFKCLVEIDNTSIADAINDASGWQASNTYDYRDFIVENNIAWWMNKSVDTCVSGGSKPTFTGLSVTDNTCTWSNVAVFTYSSQTHQIPHVQFLHGQGGDKTTQFTQNYHLQLAYGGALRPEYMAGSNGEMPVILLWSHNDYYDQDIGIYCAGQATNVIPNCGAGSSGGINWVPGFTGSYALYVEPWSSDGFAGNSTSTTNPLAYNEATGVAVHNSSNTGGQCDSGYARCRDGIAFSDSTTIINGLQVRSDNGAVVRGAGCSAGAPSTHPNDDGVFNSILDGAGSNSGDNCGAALDFVSAYLNTLVVLRHTSAGATALYSAYPGPMINNTLVKINSATDSTGLIENSPQVQPIQINNLLVGFANDVAFDTSFTVGGAGIIGTITCSACLTLSASISSAAHNPTYMLIDNEVLGMNPTGGGTGPFNITSRGLFSTTPATHAATAPILIAPVATSNNATTNADTWDGHTFSTGAGGGNATSGKLTGTSNLFNIVSSSIFVDPYSDFRLKAGASAIGAAITYSPPSNALDILGATRSTYDSGAVNYQSVIPPAVTGPGRMFLR